MTVPVAVYRYAGPFGEGMADLGAGEGAAIGSEYCAHLLPGPDGLRAAVASAASRGIFLLLLTPYFRDRELKRAVRLLKEIPKGAKVEVAVNDWGMLAAARALFPDLRLSLGRLLCGQKRCPRIGVSTRLTEAGRRWHEGGLFTSAKGRRYLAASFGVTGFHVDIPPWGGFPFRTHGEEQGEEPEIFVHVPYALVTLSDFCPWLGGKSSAAISSCPRPCRAGAVVLREPSMGGDLIQRGKARFAASGPLAAVQKAGWGKVRLVRYDDLP